jgi:hypothetical protein
MACLVRDQNQGTRNDAPGGKTRLSRPFSFIRTFTVGFGIAPNLLTLPQAETQDAETQNLEGARGLGLVTLTAGGEFHPALRTSAARDERPEANYAQAPRPQQDASPSGIRMPHRFQRETSGRAGPEKLTLEASRRRARREAGAPDSHSANPIPVCSHGKS